MKHLFFILLTLSAIFANAQGIDSTKIPQTLVTKQKYVLHFLGSMDWSRTDVINCLNEFRPQYDSVGRELSDKLITLTNPSGMLADGMRQLSYLSEGMATQYNEDMLTEVLPQITNQWLYNQMLLIRDENFKRRDERNRGTALRVEQIKPL